MNFRQRTLCTLMIAAVLLLAFNGLAWADNGFEQVKNGVNGLISHPTQLYVSPNVANDGLAFAYTPLSQFNGNTGYLFYSEDSGNTWSISNSSLNSDYNDLAFLPDGSILVAGEPDNLVPDLYVSKDGGSTWNPIGPSQVVLPDTMLPDAIVPAGNKLLGVFGTSVYVSADGGLTWPNEIAYGVFANQGSLAAIDDQTYLAVMKNDEVIRTNDGGKTWVNTGLSVGTAPTPDSYQTYQEETNWAMNSYYSEPRIANVPGLAVVSSPSGPGQLYISRDDGNTWRKVDGSKFVSGEGDSTEIAYCAAVAPGGLIFAGTTDGVLVSEDYGETWQQAGGNIAGAVTEIACGQTGDKVLVLAAASGLYRMEYTRKND